VQGVQGGAGEELVGALVGAILLTVLAVVCCVVTFRVLHNKTVSRQQLQQRPPSAFAAHRRRRRHSSVIERIDRMCLYIQLYFTISGRRKKTNKQSYNK